MKEKETILVTGGAGYIGSHTVKLLYSKGYNVVVLDNLSRGHRFLAKWGDFIEGDLNNYDLLKNIFLEKRIKAVIHFAAFAYVGESMEKPGMYYRNNLANTINLINVMVESNVKMLIFSSTCSTYGNPMQIPITEQHMQDPINPYGKSKYMIENILKDFDRAYGLKSISLRYFNAAGADPDCEIGEMHDLETHLIPNVIEVALGKQDCLNVWGSDYDTQDGTCIRDYIHVNDLAGAHIKAFEKLMASKKTGFYNLGTGNGYSVKDIIKAVENVAGEKIKVSMKPRREGDPPVLVADSTKANNELMWKPEYSDLHTIIKTAWDWHSKQCKNK